MAKNHWHSSNNTTRSEAYKYGYKSGLEHVVAEQILETEYELRYETEIINYNNLYDVFNLQFIFLYKNKNESIIIY